MTGYLVSEFKNYYKWVGNQMIFQNPRGGPIGPGGKPGLNLNQLADAMARVPGGEATDPSVISRGARGERPLHIGYVSAFADVLELNATERAELIQAWFRDQTAKHGVPLHLIPPYFIDLLEEQLKYAESVRIQGNAPLAKLLAADYADSIYPVLTTTSAETLNRLIELLLLFRFEEGEAIREYAERSDVMAYNEPIHQEIRRLAMVLGSDGYMALADYTLADAFYVAGDYAKAVTYFMSALNGLKDPRQIAEAKRGLYLSHCHMERFGAAQAYRLQIQDLIDKDTTQDSYHTTSLVDALAQGAALTSQAAMGFKIFQENTQYFDQLSAGNSKAPFRRTQRDRTHVNLIAVTRPLDKLELERVATLGIARALEYSYRRHADDIKKTLAQYLEYELV